MDGSSAGGGGKKTKQFNFQHFSSHFVFLRLLCHGWLLCKHSSNRGQTKSFQSIPQNPVAPACFLGERCSLTCQIVCTYTQHNSYCIKGSTISILTQSAHFRRADEAHRRSHKLSGSDTKDEEEPRHVCVRE